jgi:hypothetical protein
MFVFEEGIYEIDFSYNTHQIKKMPNPFVQKFLKDGGAGEGNFFQKVSFPHVFSLQKYQ